MLITSEDLFVLLGFLRRVVRRVAVDVSQEVKFAPFATRQSRHFPLLLQLRTTLDVDRCAPRLITAFHSALQGTMGNEMVLPSFPISGLLTAINTILR